MRVIDASVVVTSLQNPEQDRRVTVAQTELVKDSIWAVPDHWYVESLNGLRGLRLGRKLDQEEYDRAVNTLVAMRVKQFPIKPLTARIVELGNNLTAYDAAYVALAEHLGATLLTADVRIRDAGVARCPVVIVE